MFQRLDRIVAFTILTFLVGCGGTEPLGYGTRPIIGGAPVNASQFYATVGIRLGAGGGSSCTGTLIQPDIVVTAAHCVTDSSGTMVTRTFAPSEVTVIYGAAVLDNAEPAQTHAVMGLRVHADYLQTVATTDPTGLGAHENDLAVLRLSAPVPNVTPVALLPSGDLDTVLTAGRQIIITGYGARRVAINADGGQSSEDDGELYIAETPFVRRTALEFLVGDTGQPDTCEGDSGGPGYVNVGGTLYLVGATARARTDTTVLCGAGGIFTLVPGYASWVADQIAALGGTVADGGTPAADGGAPPADAGTNPPQKSSGCGCQTRGGASDGLLFVLLALLTAVAIRRMFRTGGGPT